MELAGADRGTVQYKGKTHKVTLQTQEEENQADSLRKAFGKKNFSELCRYLITKEAESKTLVKNRIDKIKSGES